MRRNNDNLPHEILTSDPLSAVSPAERTAPYEALSSPPSETFEPLAVRPVDYVCRTMRDTAKRVERTAPPTPLPSAPAPSPTAHILATMVTDARFKRVGLEFGAAHGLRRHGRARH